MRKPKYGNGSSCIPIYTTDPVGKGGGERRTMDNIVFYYPSLVEREAERCSGRERAIG